MKIISGVGLALIAFGVWRGFESYTFVSRAIELPGVVDSVEELKGPPKPRQKVPLHVSYSLPDGTRHRVVTHMPMLQKIESGDTIRILVDRSNPQDVRLPLWSELWAGPLTYVVGGLLLMLMGRLLRGKATR
ncbi:MAG: hypothetical protein RL326_1980 [Pseudomonadota bacterium]|jgi:hypothetical protein